MALCDVSVCGAVWHLDNDRQHTHTHRNTSRHPAPRARPRRPRLTSSWRLQFVRPSRRRAQTKPFTDNKPQNVSMLGKERWKHPKPKTSIRAGALRRRLHSDFLNEQKKRCRKVSLMSEYGRSLCCSQETSC